MKNLLIAITLLLTFSGFTFLVTKNEDLSLANAFFVKPTITVSEITVCSARITLSYVDGQNTSIYYARKGENFPNHIQNLTSNSIVLKSLSPDTTYEVVVMGTYEWKDAPKVTFQTQKPHCYANVNGVMKICDGSCTGIFSTCNLPLMITDQICPNFKLIKNGQLLPMGMGNVAPGWCITPAGVKQNISIAHPGVAY